MLSGEILLLVDELKLVKAQIQLEKEKNKKKPESKLQKLLSSKVQNKSILKKSQGTVVFKKEEPHSKYFKREWERAKWV